MAYPIWVFVLLGIGCILFLTLVGIGVYHIFKFFWERHKKNREWKRLGEKYQIDLADSPFEEKTSPFLPAKFIKAYQKKKHQYRNYQTNVGNEHQDAVYSRNRRLRSSAPDLTLKSDEEYGNPFSGYQSLSEQTQPQYDGDLLGPEQVHSSKSTPSLNTSDPFQSYNNLQSRLSSSHFCIPGTIPSEGSEPDRSTTPTSGTGSTYNQLLPRDYRFRSKSSSDILVAESYDNFEEDSVDSRLPFSEPGFRSKTMSAVDLTNIKMEVPGPCLKFSVNIAEENSIGVTVNYVADIPPKYHKNSIYIKINFFPNVKKAQTTRYVRHSGNKLVSFNECFEFCGVEMEDLEKCILRFCVLAKEAGISKDSIVGDLVIKCTKLEWTESGTSYCKELNTKRIMKRGTTSSKMIHLELGQLFLVMQSQPIANRVKVFVRKAINLPKSEKLAGQPEYYVIVNLLKSGRHVTYKETRSQKGQSPVWNEPFLFDICTDDCESYSIELIVMRGRIFHSNGVLGHVVIGSSNTNKRGIEHWEEVFQPHGLEAAKWHDILPMVNYIGDDSSTLPFN